MKKVLRILLFVFLAVALVVGGAVAWLGLSGLPKYDEPVPELTVKVSPEKVARGAKIAGMVCNHCHMGKHTNQLVGAKVEDIPAAFGTVYSPNITQDPEVGIGSWSDGELARLIRSGIKKDGSYSPPYMPKFPLLADEDLEAVIAFLRSDHPLVQPNSEPDEPSKPSLLVKFLARTAFKPLPYPDAPILVPDTSDAVAYGEYLATGQLGCYECHSADFTTNNSLEPEKSLGYFGGGAQMLRLTGEVVYSPNITMDPETGIGSWTEQEFIDAVRLSQNPRGGNYRYPMNPYTQLTEEEARAIYAYIKTVPPIKNDVTRLAAKN